MNLSYRKILNKSRLILSDFNIQNFDSDYMLKMLINNDIEGLLPAELNMINSLPSLCYDITSKHSLASFIENKKVDYSLLSSILNHLHNLCEVLNQYMLDSSYILLSPEVIFLNPESKTPYFCYCPIAEDNTDYSLSDQLKTLLDFVIAKLDYSDSECVALAYTLHKKCSGNLFSPSDLICGGSTPKTDIPKVTNLPDENTCNNEIINVSESDEPIPEIPFRVFGLPVRFAAIPILIIISGIILISFATYLHFIKKCISSQLFIVISLLSPVIFLLCFPYFNNKRKYYNYLYNDNETDKPLINKTKSEYVCNDAKKDSIMEIGDTVLINHQPKKNSPHLIYSGNDFTQDIHLDTFPFTIGKIPDSASFIIENSLISRIHARFYFKDNCYYVEDMNSSNGTYVNDILISPHTMTEITDGDFITFAHLTYIFKLY